MTTVGAAVCLALALRTWAAGSSPARHRLRWLARRHGEEPPLHHPSRLTSRPAVMASAVVAGGSAALVVGGLTGLALGVLVAVAVPPVVARLPSGSQQRSRAATARDLPFALDLVAACLAAGASISEAVTTVAREIGPPVGDILDPVVRHLELGASPEQAWAAARDIPEFAVLADTVIRVGDSGAALAPALRRLAAGQRDTTRRRRAAAARRAGVLVVVPLGLCFLPAFLLLSVVPVLVGLVGELLG